jgi:thiamine-phosphate pyrophosphorylase
MNNFGIYLIITNPVLEYSKIAEIAVKQKIKYLQLREKDKSDREIITILKDLKSITNMTDTKLIIDDRPDLAQLCQTDGLHLGQKDIPIKLAKKIYQNGIYGLSSHSFEQAKSVLEQSPDYIGFGPIYQTPTKKNPDPVVGTNLIKQVVNYSNVPVVAIGGINQNNIEEVISAGAKNICMVRYFMESKNLEDRIRIIKEKLQKVEE